MVVVAEQYAEEQLLDGLLRDSSQFREFYKSERDKISQPIAWMRDARLPEGVRAEAKSNRDEGFHVIGLRVIPIAVENAGMVAEELEHCIYAEEGFPGVLPVMPEYSSLAGIINSMLGDPIAHTRLRAFGFDFRQTLERENLESLRQLRDRAEPTNRADVFLWMANYASNALECIAMELGEDALRTWFDATYPRIAEKAIKLLRRIERAGYATPQAQERLLRDIVRRYDLEPFVVVRPP